MQSSGWETTLEALLLLRVLLAYQVLTAPRDGLRVHISSLLLQYRLSGVVCRCLVLHDLGVILKG